MTYQFQGDRTVFLQLLNENKGVMIFKYTADWCKPCQSIKSEVDAHFSRISSDSVLCFEVDVDENFDLFAYMKTKKMMKGIPTLMAYKKGTTILEESQQLKYAIKLSDIGYIVTIRDIEDVILTLKEEYGSRFKYEVIKC